MSSNTTQVVTGSFVATGNPINITIPSNVNWLQVIDATGSAGAATSGTGLVKAFWSSDMPAGAAYFEIGNGSGAITPNYLTTNGFTPFAVSGPEGVGAIHSGTAITNASPAVVSSSTTVPVGSVVRINSSVGMEQIAGWDFYVTASSAGSTFTLGYLPAAGFAAAGTTTKFCVINPLQAWYPQWRLITAITQASSCVVTLSVTHNYQVGQLVRVKCPNAFGMSQIAGQVGQITAINTSTNTVTLNINTSGYTAFAFPTSATAAAGDQWPMLIPIGEFPNTTGAVPFDNTGTIGLTFGTNVCGASSDQMYWAAYSGVPIS